MDDEGVHAQIFFTDVEAPRSSVQAQRNGALSRIGRAIVCEHLKVNPTDICYNEYGKPYIPNTKNYFNISHSGAAVAVAFSRHEIGLDIELIKERKNIELIAKRFFCKNEYDFIKNSDNTTEAFYYVWTRKEAFLKALGRGFYEKINSHDCLNDEIYFHQNNQNNWYIKSFFLKEGFAAACCAAAGCGDANIGAPLNISKITELRYDAFKDL